MRVYISYIYIYTIYHIKLLKDIMLLLNHISLLINKYHISYYIILCYYYGWSGEDI